MTHLLRVPSQGVVDQGSKGYASICQWHCQYVSLGKKRESFRISPPTQSEFEGVESRTHVCRQIAEDGAEDGAECCTEGTHVGDLQRVVVGEKARNAE